MFINLIVNDKNIYLYENTTSSRIRTIEPQCSKEKFLALYFTIAALPLSMANSSYYNVNPINC